MSWMAPLGQVRKWFSNRVPSPDPPSLRKGKKSSYSAAASSYFLGKPATNGSTKSQLATMTQWRSGAFPETPGYPLSSVTLV